MRFDLLTIRRESGDVPGVEKSFATALLWHMDRAGTGVAELSRATGVSANVIKKMRIGAVASTTAENAVAISRFYGKTVSQFLECDEDVAIAKLVHLIDLLSPEEREQLERQVLGLLQTRGPKPSR